MISGARVVSGAHPSSVLGSVISIIVDYGIPIYLCGDRQHACRFVEDLAAVWRSQINVVPTCMFGYIAK